MERERNFSERVQIIKWLSNSLKLEETVERDFLHLNLKIPKWKQSRKMRRVRGSD